MSLYVVHPLHCIIGMYAKDCMIMQKVLMHISYFEVTIIKGGLSS